MFTFLFSPRLGTGAGVKISDDDCSDCSENF